MSDSEDDKQNGYAKGQDDFVVDDNEDDKDLFGSGSEEGIDEQDAPRGKRRKLDDSELDSGDDEGRQDRGQSLDGEDAEPDVQKRDYQVRETAIGRHAVPKGSDGELYHLRFPDTIGINPKAFDLVDFKPPETDHHSSAAPSPAFSAFNTAVNTIRYRKSPNEPSEIQSNARILRWSDGSLTLQLASSPLEQHQLNAKSLTAPQINPRIPTPTSRRMPNVPSNHKSYTPAMDSHEYLAAPHEHAGLVRHTNHVTAALTVESSEHNDEALIRLQESLAAAKSGKKTPGDGGLEVINITEDPELAKKRAETAEKERNKQLRRLQGQRERETTRVSSVLRRSGLKPGGMGTGFTVGGLEDDLGGGRPKGAKKGPKKPRRRNSEYSEDEDMYGRGGRTKEDEYDEDDGFLVASDEEIEEGGASDEEEEDDADMDAEGEEDDDVNVAGAARKESAKQAEAGSAGPGASSGRAKNKRVIDDEDEE